MKALLGTVSGWRGLAAALLALALAGFASAAEPAGPAGPEPEAADSIRIFDADEMEAAPRDQAAAKTSLSAFSTVTRTAFWLGLTLVMLCGLVLLARKFLPRSMSMFRSGAVELLGRTYLDPKKCLYLVKVGSRCLVVGSGDGGLSCLSEITDGDEVEHLACLSRSGADSAAGTSGGRSFKGLLGSRLSGLLGGTKRQVDEPIDDNGDFYGADSLRERAEEPAAVVAGGGFEELKESLAQLKSIA